MDWRSQAKRQTGIFTRKIGSGELSNSNVVTFQLESDSVRIEKSCCSSILCFSITQGFEKLSCRDSITKFQSLMSPTVSGHVLLNALWASVSLHLLSHGDSLHNTYSRYITTGSSEAYTSPYNRPLTRITISPGHSSHIARVEHPNYIAFSYTQRASSTLF